MSPSSSSSSYAAPLRVLSVPLDRPLASLRSRSASSSPQQQRRPCEINVAHMSEDDLQSLAKSDPFLYHSIPAVRRADLMLGDVTTEDEAVVVSRRSRLSTESHISVFLDDIFSDDELYGNNDGAKMEDFEEPDEEYEDLILQLLRLAGSSSSRQVGASSRRHQQAAKRAKFDDQ